MKAVLITGAGRKEGIGFATAIQLGKQGYHVILSGRHLEPVDALVANLKDQGLTASALRIDLQDEESVYASVSAVTERVGRLDVLINNAAMMVMSPSGILEKDLDELSNELHTNIIGTWRVTRAFHGLLAAGGHGRIVNVSSGAGSFWDPDFGLVNYPGFGLEMFGDTPISGYALTKLALNGLTIKMSKEFRENRILVNSVCPGVTATRAGMEQWARPASESAKGIVWAATLPDDGPTGLFFRDGKQIPW